MSRRLLWIHGLFGLLGVALGVALALRLAAAVGWQEQLLSRGKGPLGLVVLAILLPAFAARRIRDVLFLQDCDYFVGDRAQALAQAVAEEEQAEAEAEREYERKSIAGWPYMLFLIGFAVGMFFAYRWLPEADATTAFQGSVSGFIGSATTLYLLKMKPSAWQVWLGVALAWALGFLVFTHAMWHRSPFYLLLGTLWGVGVGIATTLLYPRKLRGK